jgi:hypothetical protein
VDNTSGVSGVERVGDVGGNGKKSIDFQRRSCNTVFQRHAIQKFHDDEGLSVLLINLMDRADVRMI